MESYYRGRSRWGLEWGGTRSGERVSQGLGRWIEERRTDRLRNKAFFFRRTTSHYSGMILKHRKSGGAGSGDGSSDDVVLRSAGLSNARTHDLS